MMTDRRCGNCVIVLPPRSDIETHCTHVCIDAFKARNERLKATLQAALHENQSWYTEAAIEEERLLNMTEENDSRDTPVVGRVYLVEDLREGTFVLQVSDVSGDLVTGTVLSSYYAPNLAPGETTTINLTARWLPYTDEEAVSLLGIVREDSDDA